MLVEFKRSKNNSSFFVFSFQTNDEYNEFIDYVKDLVSFADDSFEADFSELTEKISNRCSDKYATDDIACSFMLFADEASRFMLYFYMTSKSEMSSYDKLMEQYDDLLNIDD